MRVLRVQMAALLLAAAPAVVALAQQPDQPRPGGPPDRPFGPPPLGFQIFRALDPDGDGVISKEEIAAAAEALAKLDKNGDGSLTREEYLGAFTPPGGPGGGPGVAGGEQFARGMLQAADKDGDGKISKEEAVGPFRDNFDSLDANKDGQLDLEELVGAPRRIAASRPPGGNIVEQMVARLMEADKDGDGKISKEEAPDRLKQNFDNLDGDKNGQLDKEELLAMARRFGAGRSSAELTQQFVNGLFDRFDKDSDGKISKEEAPERLKAVFDTVDANKDGVADREELNAAAGQLGLRPGGAGRPRPLGEGRPAPESPPTDKPASDQPKREGDQPKPESDN